MLNAARSRSIVYGSSHARCKNLISHPVFSRSLSAFATPIGKSSVEHRLVKADWRTSLNKHRFESDKLTSVIETMFSKGYVTVEEAGLFFSVRLKECRKLEIALILHQMGPKSKKQFHHHLRFHLPAIASQIGKLSTTSWKFGDIASVLYGLQCMDENTEGYLRIIEIMTEAAIKTLKNGYLPMPSNISMMMIGLQNNSYATETSRKFIPVLISLIKKRQMNFGRQAIGNSLYGMKGMTSDVTEVRTLLAQMGKEIIGIQEDLNPQEIGNALYGMQGMRSDNPEVVALLAAISPKIESCKNNFFSQEIGNALYGLKKMSSDSPEVREILRVLLPIVDSCQQPFKAQEIGNALYGMQGMSSEYSEVRNIFSALATKVRNSPSLMSSSEISNALYGLQRSKSDNEEMRMILSALTFKLKNCKELFSGQNLGNAFYGLNGMSSNDQEVLDLLAALLPKMQLRRITLSPQELSNTLYGLHEMSSDSPIVRDIVSAFISHAESCEKPLKALEIGIALYGMKGMKSSHFEVRALLKVLTPKIRSCYQKFTPRNVGNALYGLQGMSSDNAEVSHFLSAFIPHVLVCDKNLNSQELSNALYGMKRMTNRDPQVRALLSALANIIKDSRIQLSAQGIGLSLFGMQEMNSDCAEVREVLSSLAPLIRNFKGTLDAQAIGNALYGLKEMNSDSREVRDILAAIRPSLNSPRCVLDGTAVGNAFYGLQGMDGKVQEVKDVLSALQNKVRTFNGILNVRAVGDTLYGIKNRDASEEANELLLILHSHICAIQDDSDGYRELPILSLRYLCQVLSVVLPELRKSMNNKKNNILNKWELTLTVLLSRLRTHKSVKSSDSTHSNRSAAEIRMHAVVANAVKTSNISDITFTSSIHLFDVYEADFVITTLQGKYKRYNIENVNPEKYNLDEDNTQKVIDILNIEVDGVSHLQQKSKRFSALRDEYLLSRGVRVERISTQDLWSMTSLQLEKWVKGILIPPPKIRRFIHIPSSASASFSSPKQ